MDTEKLVKRTFLSLIIFLFIMYIIVGYNHPFIGRDIISGNWEYEESGYILNQFGLRACDFVSTNKNGQKYSIAFDNKGKVTKYSKSGKIVSEQTYKFYPGDHRLLLSDESNNQIIINYAVLGKDYKENSEQDVLIIAFAADNKNIIDNDGNLAEGEKVICRKYHCDNYKQGFWGIIFRGKDKINFLNYFSKFI